MAIKKKSNVYVWWRKCLNQYFTSYFGQNKCNLNFKFSMFKPLLPCSKSVFLLVSSQSKSSAGKPFEEFKEIFPLAWPLVLISPLCNLISFLEKQVKKTNKKNKKTKTKTKTKQKNSGTRFISTLWIKHLSPQHICGFVTVCCKHYRYSSLFFSCCRIGLPLNTRRTVPNLRRPLEFLSR